MGKIVHVVTITHMSKKKLILVSAVVSLLVAAGVMFALFQDAKKPLQNNSETVVFHIEPGESSSSVFSRLESDGIIKSAFVAKLESKLNGFSGVFQGNFKIDKSWSLREVLDYIGNGVNAAPETANVLLVEGSWARDMAKTIASQTLTSEERFLELWNNPEYIQELMTKYPSLPQEILDNKNARVLLEGFLYPDTYQFNISATEEEVTEIILSNFEKHYSSYANQIANAELSSYELITLASIVEYEANTDEDMRKVAGVFMNRLNIDMMLQSSVTVCYALYEFESWTECESSQPDSPYNTYQHTGLTPGPILNPSIRSIQATLDYDKNDYFFFVADVYGDGSVHYQKTYAEHEIVRKQLLGY